MRPEDVRFPEYGSGGDITGARRLRRAFRFGAGACVLFTIGLWFSDQYLRYDLTEQQYRSAITIKNPESARVFLLSAVKMDKAHNKTQTPKYLAALAERQDDDLALATYKEAYDLDPNNASLAIRYGCRLFMAGYYEEARERFREAEAKNPSNALPAYLEAAATPWCVEGEEGLSASLAIVARANTNNAPLTFPEPLWFSTLPQDGVLFAQLRRNIVDEVCAPLYQYAWHVRDKAQESISRGNVQMWDAWLDILQNMGRRLVVNSTFGTIQAIAGVRIQLEAVSLLEQLNQQSGQTPSEYIIEQRLKLKTALELLQAFETNREQRINQDERKYAFPILSLLRPTLIILFLAYFAIYLLHKTRRGNSSAWTIKHGLAEIIVLVASNGLFFLLLTISAIFQRFTGPSGGWMNTIGMTWWALAAGLLLFCLIYPGFRLPKPVEVVQHYNPVPDESAALLRHARKRRRTAYITLMRRYLGLYLGLLLIAVSGWVVAYRVTTSLYPWQFELLTTGLATEEVQAVQKSLETLQP